MGMIMDILRGAGNALSLPGSSIRDLLGGENPFDQWATPFSDQNRLSGEDLLRKWGAVGPERSGMSAAAGVATDIATDPLTWLGIGAAAKGAGALTSALKGAGAARSATEAAPGALQAAMRASARPATALSIASPVAGAYLMGDNQENEPWKNILGGALMAAPLVMGAAKWSKKSLAKWNAEQEAALAAKRPAAQPVGEYGVTPISRPEIDFMEQFGIRDATKWQAIKQEANAAGLSDVRQLPRFQ